MIGYLIWDLDPRVFKALDFFRWYGVCWAVGMMLGYALTQYIYKKEKLPLASLDKLVGYLIIGIIVGARLGHIFFYDPAYYLAHPIEVLPIRLEPHFEFTGLAGLASHGGIAGALIALYIFKRKYKIEMLSTLDRLVIGGALIGGFIRLGNLMNSEIIGIPTDVSWAFVFTQIDNTPRHPSQLYEAMFYFAISGVLYGIWKSKRASIREGFLFGLGVAFIFLQRFFVEFLKENQVSFEDQWPLNMGQLLSIPLIILGLLFVLRSYIKRA